MGQSSGVGWVVQEILPRRRVKPWAVISFTILCSIAVPILSIGTTL
jgi:hypothetical protein